MIVDSELCLYTEEMSRSFGLVAPDVEQRTVTLDLFGQGKRNHQWKMKYAGLS